MSKFATLKEYQLDIKKRYPFGVPFITPYEAFCAHYYNFATIDEDYGINPKPLENTRPIRVAPAKVLPPRIATQPQKPVNGVQL